jgi:DNA-binding protein H-NS
MEMLKGATLAMTKKKNLDSKKMTLDSRKTKPDSKKVNLDTMSAEEMWELHGEISRALSVRLTSEKRKLEERLGLLHRDREAPSLNFSHGMKELPPVPRRKYPRVYPKYQNPEEPSETWSGRGKTPQWFKAALQKGHKPEDFAIGYPGALTQNNAQNAG